MLTVRQVKYNRNFLMVNTNNSELLQVLNSKSNGKEAIYM